ncbi:MAG: dihydropteroate synthase [Alphaproteobacteria bacterium]|nr:dihydropteroate synthase [Alphaproteobacteria bacterium]
MIDDASPGPFRGLSFPEPATGRLYLRPLGLVPLAHPSGDPGLLPLAGGPFAFGHVELLLRAPDGIKRAVASLATLSAWARQEGAAAEAFVDAWRDRTTKAALRIAGLVPDRPHIMGIVNVTPDSFSDGGAFSRPTDAIEHGRALAAAGADILDIGGESTRPGASPVSAAEQCDRVRPVIEGLRDAGVPLAIDTRDAAVMRAAVAAGASIINDVSALAHDPDSLAAARELAVPVILTHMRGAPDTMADRARYDDVALDVFDELEDRVETCEASGIPRASLIVDPGFGFAKTTRQNAALLARLGILHGLGCPIAVGASRKTFAPGQGRRAARDRLAGSLAAGLAAVAQGARMLRVHDVAATRDALTTFGATLALREDI